MDIDMRSVLVVAAVSEILFAALMLGSWSTRRTESASIYWSLGSLLVGLGCLASAFRGQVPDSIGVVGTNAVMFAGLGFRLAGMRSFGGQPVHLGLLMLPAVLVAALFSFRDELGLDIPRRMMIAGPLGVGFGLLMLADLVRAQHREPLTMRRIVIVVIALQTVNDIVRYAVGATGSFPGGQFLQAGNLFALLMLNVLVVYGLLNIGCFMMVFERHERQLVRAATVDTLTGLLNRAGFRQLAERQLQRSRHERQPLSVLVLDLDHFKRVNDRHGHEAGDAVLQAFARCARAALRPTDLLSRPGGEEFWALLPGSDLAEAQRIAQRVCDQFRRIRVAREDFEIAATVSIGVAEVHPPSEALQAALARADQALYEAKGSGRDRVALAAPAALPVLASARPS